MSALHIRAVSKQEIPLIRELTYAVWPQTYASMISPGQIDYMLDMMYSVPSLEKQMDSGCCFVVIESQKRPVGFASYQDLGESRFKLHKIYVLPDQQGKGTGKTLIEWVIKTAKEQGGKTLELQVNRENVAKHFYERLGFEVSYDADFDIGGGYLMRDHIMTKKL